MTGNSHPIYDFSVGPATLHPRIGEWMQEFVHSGWGAVNHRSDRFHELYSSMVSKLCQLLGVGDDYMILVADSGSTLMEKTLLGLADRQTYHFVLGAFGKKQKVFAERLGLDVQSIEASAGGGLGRVARTILPSTDLICLTHCETSTGVQLSNDWIQDLRGAYPDIPISLDMVSSAPFTDLDLRLVDSFFFSCQKAFGLPAGLGIWGIRRELAYAGSNNVNKGAHQRLSEYIDNFSKWETVSTPNVLGMFLLEKACTDFLFRGKNNIIETLGKRKSMLMEAIGFSEQVDSIVTEAKNQSDSIFVCQIRDTSPDFLERMRKQNIILAEGYGPFKKTQIRIGNFIALPDEAYETLVSVL